MNFYSKAKFDELSERRQLHVILTLIKKIESEWKRPSEKKLLLERLLEYFQWFDFFNSEDRLLQKLANLEFNISTDMSLRTLLDIAVPMERYLELAVKDEHIFKVTSVDRVQGQRRIEPLCLILDHLRSAFNVGSIFRTAECMGIEHVYLVGYTPTPADSGVIKTAMGTEAMVSWSSHHHLEEVVDLLQAKSYSVVALETADNAVSLFDFPAKKPMALLVGNERFGLQNSALLMADQCVTIPMRGQKNSLNVANSVSVSAFEIIRQWS